MKAYKFYLRVFIVLIFVETKFLSKNFVLFKLIRDFLKELYQNFALSFFLLVMIKK